MSKIVEWYNRLGKLRVKIPRLIDSYKEFNLKKKNFPYRKPTKEQFKAIKAFWGDIKPSLKYLSLYNFHNESFDPRYIPDDMYYGTIDTYFNNGIDCFALDDKNFYNLYFPDVKQPKTIARKNSGIYTDNNYQIITLDKVISLCEIQGSVIIKQSTLSNGGNNIIFWDISKGIDNLRKNIINAKNIIIQEIVEQHQDIGKVHPSSLNSIRMLTLTYENQVHILSTIVRMGANGSNVDNGHSGGIFCGVDNCGRFKNVAYTYMTGDRYDNIHPTTNIRFSDCRIPNFDKCKEAVTRLAPRLCRISRLTSWDLTVDKNCEPVLIEVNLAYGGLFFHQIANGPVFGDLTKKILDEVNTNTH